MRGWLLGLMVLFAGCGWSKGDVIRESVWMGLHAADWAQTRQIAKQPDRFRELNPVLGSHPSVGEVDLYMGAWMVVHPVITHYLPSEYRSAWQYVTIGVSGGAVVNNVSLGVRF